MLLLLFFIFKSYSLCCAVLQHWLWFICVVNCFSSGEACNFVVSLFIQWQIKFLSCFDWRLYFKMSPYSRETPKIAIPMYAAYTSISIQEHSCTQNWDIHIHFAKLPPTVSNFVSSEVQSKERGIKVVMLFNQKNPLWPVQKDDDEGKCGLTTRCIFALHSGCAQQQ